MGAIEVYNLDTGEIEIFSPRMYSRLIGDKKYRVLSTPWDFDEYEYSLDSSAGDDALAGVD